MSEVSLSINALMSLITSRDHKLDNYKILTTNLNLNHTNLGASAQIGSVMPSSGSTST